MQNSWPYNSPLLCTETGDRVGNGDALLSSLTLSHELLMDVRVHGYIRGCVNP